MRIDSNNNTSNINGLGAGSTPAQQASDLVGAQQTASAQRPQAGESVHESYIRKAVASDIVDLQAVAEAKMLLESGQLDTPGAIARAAENIVVRGIL
ncbi:MAG: hypothetical protein HN350_00085 [Phycisphaerales bacterium]|nr:hypothetical protein [Phycisphaerales bacterium]